MGAYRKGPLLGLRIDINLHVVEIFDPLKWAIFGQMCALYMKSAITILHRTFSDAGNIYHCAHFDELCYAAKVIYSDVNGVIRVTRFMWVRHIAILYSPAGRRQNWGRQTSPIVKGGYVR